MLDDHDVPVRIAVVVTLGDFKDNRTLPLLKKALQDPVPEVDFAAAKVLYQLHDPDGVQFLLDVVSKESKASSSYLSKEKRGALRLLHTPTQLFTTIAIGAAGFAPVPGLGFGLSSARGILSAPDSSARAASLLLIGGSRDPALADAVGSALSDKEWSVRAAAAHLVAMHPFPQFREQLVPLLDDKKDAVRVRAAAAYIRLQHNTKGCLQNTGSGKMVRNRPILRGCSSHPCPPQRVPARLRSTGFSNGSANWAFFPGKFCGRQ